MTDQEHADAISAAVQTLNAAIRRAHADGLKIGIETLEITQIDMEHARPMIAGHVLRTRVEFDQHVPA